MFARSARDGALVPDRLALSPGAKVADVGASVGNFAIFLALNGFDVTKGQVSR